MTDNNDLQVPDVRVLLDEDARVQEAVQAKRDIDRLARDGVERLAALREDAVRLRGRQAEHATAALKGRIGAGILARRVTRQLQVAEAEIAGLENALPTTISEERQRATENVHRVRLEAAQRIAREHLHDLDVHATREAHELRERLAAVERYLHDLGRAGEDLIVQGHAVARDATGTCAEVREAVLDPDPLIAWPLSLLPVLADVEHLAGPDADTLRLRLHENGMELTVLQYRRLPSGALAEIHRVLKAWMDDRLAALKRTAPVRYGSQAVEVHTVRM